MTSETPARYGETRVLFVDSTASVEGGELILMIIFMYNEEAFTSVVHDI